MNRTAWQHYLEYYQHSKNRIAGAILISILQSFIVMPVAYLVKEIIDRVIPGGDLRILVIFSLGIILLQLLDAGLSLLVRSITLRVTKEIIKRIRCDLLGQLMERSQSYFEKADLSILHSRIIQDTERVDVMSNALIAVFLPAAVVSLVMVVLLFTINWYLSVLLLVVAPLVVFFGRKMSRRVKSSIQRFQRVFSEFSQGILFTIQNFNLVRISSAEEFELNRQSRKIEELQVVSGDMAMYHALFKKIQESLTAVGGIAILGLGGWAVISGRMTVGDLVSYYVLVGILRKRFNAVVSSVPFLQEGSESLLILDQFRSREAPSPYRGEKKITFQGEIMLRGVSFGYEDENILENLTLSLTPAQGLMMIIGPNGIGKTTLFNLVLGLYAPWKGELKADGVPYSTLDITHLRKEFGVVPQSPVLFQGTIRDNISYGKPDASPEELRAASKLAAAHGFITRLPDQYQTLLGDRGEGLSGSERQRIAIARALLGDPQLLLMDEPTNHLDESMKKGIIANLKSTRKGKTTVIISHDEDIIKSADTLYRINDGRAVRVSGLGDDHV